MAKTITGIKAGTTTITATYGGVTSNGVSFTVGKIDASLTFEVNSTALTYNGDAQLLGTISYDGDGQAKYYVSTSNSAPSASASGWVNCSDGTEVEATNAGTYYIFLQASEGTNYNAVAVKSGNTTGKQIAKATPTFTTTNGSVKYHNTVYAQGKPSVAGKIYWGTSTSTMTSTVSASANTNTNITSRTAVGKTTIYAYFVPTDTTNYNSVGSSSSGYKTITAEVTQATDASVTVTLDSAGTYGSAATLVAAEHSTSHGTSAAYVGYKYGSAATADGQITWVSVGTELSLAASASAGTYYIYKKWTADGNHSNSATYTQVDTLTRLKTTLTVTESPYSGTYDGSSHSSTVKVTSSGWDGGTIVCGTSTSYGTTVTTSGVTNTSYAVKTATNYTASTTIYYKITGGTNYNDYADSVTFEIKKKTPKLTFTPVNGTLTYNGSTQNIGTISYDGDGKFYYAVTTSNSNPSTGWTEVTSGTTIKSSAATAMTYYVWLKSDAGTNYAAVASSSNKGSKAIGKATPTMSLSGSDTTYPTESVIKGNASVAGTIYWGTTSATSGMTNTTAVSAANVGKDVNITSKTTSGTLTVYAYFVPTDTTNYNSLGSSSNDHASKSVTVSKGTPTFTLSGSNTTYHTTAYIKGNASVAGTIYWGTTSATSGMTNTTAVSAANAGKDVNITSRTNYGTTIVYAYFVPTDSNYNSLGSSSDDHASKSVTVSKATDAKVTAALTTDTLTYDGNAKTLATVSSSEGCTYYLGYKLGSAATADSQITWGSANSNITAINAGTYYVYYKFTPDSNHSNSATYTQIGNTTRTIGAATITVSGTSNQSYVYDGSAHGSAISATTVNSQTATIKYGTSSGSYTLSSAPQVTTVADSKTVYWQVTAPNHTTRTGSYTLTITKRPINITAATDSKIYDGNPLTNNTATAEGTGTDRGLASNQSMTSCTVTGSITNAGSTPNVPSGAVIKSGSTDTTANYDITYVNGTLTVTKQSVTITAPALTSGTITYNGGNQYLSSAGSTSAGTIYYYVSTSSTTPTFSTSTWSTSRPTGQNAGTYYLWYYVSVDSNNYSGSGINTVTKIGTGSKAIAQKALTVTAASDSKVYDGNPLTINSATLSGNVSGHTLYSANYGGSQTTVGSSNSTVSDAVIKSGSTTVTGNYAITYAEGTLTVSKRPVTYTATDQSKPYDGSKLNANNIATLTSGSLVDGHSATITGSGSTSAATAGSTGTKTISVVIKSGSTDVSSNYTITTVNGTLTITKATGRVTTAPANSNVVYGSGNNLCSAGSGTGTMQYKLDSGSWSSTIPTATTSVDNGNHTLYYRAAESDNYNQSSEGSITVSIQKKGVTVTWGTTSWTYDGSTHSTTCSISSGVISGTTCTVSLSGNSVAAAAGSTATVTATLSNNNYTISSGGSSKTLSISKRPIKVTASSASRAYNSSALTSNSATAEATGTNRGLVSGHTMTSCTVEGSQTAVGSSNNVPSSAIIKSGTTDVTTNYDITYVNGTLTVTAGTLTVTATPYNATYDGTAHNGIASISAKNQENTAVTPSYTYSTDGTNYSTTMPTVTNYTAGTTIYWKATLTGYTTATGNVSAKVNKKACTVTGKNSSKVYDGTALTLASASVANKATLSGQVSGHTLSAVTCSGSITYVGTENNTPSAATIKNGSTDVTSNYSITYTPGTLTITQATPTITVTGVDKTYNNTDYYATVTKSDAKGTLYWKYGSAPTTSSYGGTKDISSVGTPVGNPSAFSTPINVTSVKNVTNQTLYWIFVPSSSTTITTGQTYAANFNDSASGSVTMKITAAAVTIPTPTGYTGTYDANNHSATFPTVTGATITAWQKSLDGGSTWTDMTSNPIRVSAGTTLSRAYYTADSNHSIGGTTGGSAWSSNATIKINQKAVTVTAGSASRTYNGSALTKADGTTASGLITGHSLTSYTNTGTQTYVGSSNNVPSAAVIKDGNGNGVTSNYAITYANGTLTVTKATPVVSITGVTEDYTGGQFWATATVNAKGTLYWKKGSAPTTSSNDGNVTISSINSATNITSVKDNSDDFEMYWLFVPSNTANSLASGHTYAENFTNAGGTSSDHKSLTINPRSITNVTASAAAVTYNGSQQTASVSISDSGGNLTSNDYTISGNTGTNATNYTITITGRNNYTGTKTITWTINKRPVTITADSNSKTYDGTALTKNSVTASAQNNTNNTGMISSHHVHSWTVSGSQTLAGSSNNTVTAATIYSGTHSGTESNVTSNYAITYASGTLTVNKAAITYTATNQTKVYDGTKLTATNTASRTAGLSSLPSGHTVTFTCTGEIGPGVTSGTKTLSSVVIKNSDGTDVTSSFTVTKVNGTLSITAATITYTNTSPVSEYCTATAVAATKTLGSVNISIASESATDYSGAAITSGSNPSTEGYTISQSGWSISSDGKTITVPANVAAGTYNITVTAAKPNHTPKANGISVQLVSVTLNNIELTLEKTTIPYGGSTNVASVTATYSNGATKDVKDDTNTSYSTNPTGIVTIS